MATEVDTPESISTMKSGREEKELLSEFNCIEFPSNEEEKPESRTNQYLEASSYEGQPINKTLVINIKVADVTEDTVGTNQDECFFKSPPVSEDATDESSSTRESPTTKIQNKTGLFNIETLEEGILKDQTVKIDPPKEACSDNELKPSMEEEPEEPQKDERASLKVDQVVKLANAGQFIDSLQLMGVSETKEVRNYTTTGNSTSDSIQGIKYKGGNVKEVESEEIEKKSEQHELLHNAKEDDCISLSDHNAEEAMENDNAAKEKIGRPYITALTEENSSEEAGTESGRHSQSFNNETKENIDEVQVKEHNLIFLLKYEIGMTNGPNGYRSIDGASDRTEETVPYFEWQSQIGSPEEILKQEISPKMIRVHEISEKGSPEVKAKEKYANDGLNEEIEGRNTEESTYKVNLPFSATGEETAEEKLKKDETDGPKPKEVKNLGMESVQSLDTICHIESKIAEGMMDDINPDEDCHTQSSRGLSEETQLKETSEDLVGSSSIPQVSLKETDDNNMEKTLSLIIEEKSIKEVERKWKTELDASNLLFEPKSRETETESDDVNSTSKLTEASKIDENTNTQISESAKNEADEAGTRRESLGETHTTLPEGEDEKEATSCETPSSAPSDQTLQESSAPLIAERKLGTTEVSEMIDDNPSHEVFHINMHIPLITETTGEKLERNEFEPMTPINGNLAELIDIPMGSVHAAEKNPESVEPQKLRSSTILVAQDQSSETFIEVNQTKMDEDIESVIEHNLGSADTNAKEKIFGGNYQEFQQKRSEEVECKSEAESPIERTKSGIETVNDVVLIEELLGEVEKVEESENIKERMVEEEKGATKLQTAFSSDKEPNKITDSALIATQNHEAAGIIKNIETSGSQVVEDINWEPEAYSITKPPEEEIIKAAEKPINNTSSPYGLLDKNAIEAEAGIHREKAETAPATVMTLEIRSDGVQQVNISASDLNATTSDNSLGIHGTVKGEAANSMEPNFSSEISPCTTPEHADVNKRAMVVENPVKNETDVEELNTSVAKETTNTTQTAKLQEAENIHWEPEASAITQAPEGPEEEIMKSFEKHIITSSKKLLLEENVREEKMEVGYHGGKAETTVAAAMTAETACGGAQLANKSTSDSDKAVAENNQGVHAPQDEATANLEFEGNCIISQLTTAEHTEVNKEPLAIDNPATDETQLEEVKISLAEPTIGDIETVKLQVVDDIKRDPEASSITETQEELINGEEKPMNIRSSAMALSEEDSREEKLEKVSVHEDDSETTAAPMMTAERSLADVQAANKSARDLDTTADKNTLEFHTTTLEGEAVSYVELEDFSERCQLTAIEYVDVYNDTMVLEKQATAETEVEDVKISNAHPIVRNVETAKLQVVEDINWDPEASNLTKAPDEEMTKGAEKPISITSSASQLSKECSREEMIEEVGNLGEDAETAEATLMTAATGSEGFHLDNVSARDSVTTAGDKSLGFHTTPDGEVEDNMELLDSSIMSQLTKPKHAYVYKETMMLEKSATDETGVEDLQISNAEPNSSEQYVHHIHESDEISTKKSSEMHTCEEVTIVEALAEGDEVEDEIPLEKITLLNELELELVEDKRIDGSGESATEEPLKESTSEEPQEYISIIQSAVSSPGSEEELEDIGHVSSLEPSKEDTLDSSELNKENELETVGENENITDESKADEDPYRNSNLEGTDNNSCSHEAGGRNVEEAPIRLDRPETKAPNEENVESHEEPRSASISKVDKQLNRTTSIPMKVDTDENSINDEGKLDSTEIKVGEQDSNDVEMEMSNEAGLENKINTREDCIETSKDVIFLREVEQVTVEKSEDIKGQICEQDTRTQELQKTTSSHEVLNETTYSDPVPIEKLEATNLSPEMKQGTEKPGDGSKTIFEGSEEEKIEEAAIVNRKIDIPPAKLLSETSSEDVQLGEKLMKDSDTENHIEKATELNETAEDTLACGMIAEDDEVVKSFFATDSIPIEEIVYLDPEPNEYREAKDLNVETEGEKLRAAEYLNWESETSSITKSPEKEAKKGTEKPANNSSPVIDVPAEKSRELKSEENIINTSTATGPGTLVTLLSLEEVQQGKMLIKGSEMKSTDENSNIKMTHTSQEDEEVDHLKLEETFVIVTAENPAKEDDAKEIFFDTVSTSIEQHPKNVLDMDKVQHEFTEVQEFIEVIQDFDATDSTPFQELSEELQSVDVQEKAEEHVTSAGSAVLEFNQDSVTVNEKLAPETNEEKAINENPSDLERQERGDEPEHTQINAKTTVEEVAYSDPAPTGYHETLDLNLYTERDKLIGEDLNWESEASFITKVPENEEKKCTENGSVIDVPEEKSRELKSETDVFSASRAIPPGSPEMEMSLEEVQQGETLIKGSDMKSTDENLNIKMSHTSQEDEEVDSMKLEEILSGKDIVFAKEQNANGGEPEEIVTSKTKSTLIEQDPKDVLDMDKFQHELTEAPKFMTENKEVNKDFMVTNSSTVQEFSEELQRVDAEEKSRDHDTAAEMPGSAVIDIYHESVADGTANENLAQETNEEKTVMETSCDSELQEKGEPEHKEINAETTVLAEDMKKSGSSDIAYSETVLTGYLEAIILNVETTTKSEELRGAEGLNLESKSSSITKPPEIEEKKDIEKPVDITSPVIDALEKKSRELKSETDLFNASTAIPPGTLVMERSLEEVQRGGTLIKGSDMKSTDENISTKMTHTDQEDEVDSIKLEETLVVTEIVNAKKPAVIKDETEEILTSDIISTSIEQNSQDGIDMDNVQTELTEVPGFVAEDKEVTNDFMVTNLIPLQELSEEHQTVDAEEKSEVHVTGAGMPESAVLNNYPESVAEGKANENLAQEIKEEKTVMETPCDLELQETREEPENMEINAETTVLAEDTKKSGSSDIAYSDTVLTGYLEAIILNVETPTKSEELRGAEGLNLESKASSITKPPEIEEKKDIEKPVDITGPVIDALEKKSRELKSETDLFNASTAIPPGTLVMERNLEEVQKGGTLIKGSDMKSTDENISTKMTHTDQEDEVDSIKLEETLVVKEIVNAKKPAVNKDETEEILTSDIVSTTIEQNPQDGLDMDNVQPELNEGPGFVAEDKEVTNDFMVTNLIPLQELSEELQRVDLQEKAEEHVTGARSAVVDVHQESFVKGTANEHIAQVTNEENIVKEAPGNLELQSTAEEPECIEISGETTVLTDENLEAVEPLDELLSVSEYVTDSQIDEPLPQTSKSNGKDSNDQNLESTIEKIIEQDYLEDQSETNEYVEHKFEETQGGHETMKDLILVEKAVVDIQEVEETGDITEEACCIQELKRISESDEKTSKRINSETIPVDNLEAIGSIMDTEKVKLMTSEDLSWKSGSPFVTDTPEEDKKQGIESTSCNISSEFEVSEKMVKEESMEKAEANPNKESENLNNPYAKESEVDKSIYFDGVSKSKKKVMEDIQRNGEGVTAVSIGKHEAIEAVVGPDKIPDIADLATNLTEKFHEPLSEMLHKEQAIETTTTTKNLEDKSQQKDATLLNECVEDTLSTRTIDAAFLQKETPKGLQLSSPGLELDAVEQNKSPNEAATDEWTVEEEAAEVEPQEEICKMKIEDSLIPSPTYILGNAVENFKEDPIQDFQKAEKVLESAPEVRLSAVTNSRGAEIKEEHHKRAMTAQIDGEIHNEITDETTGTIKKEILSEKTTLDKEVAKDSLVVSANEGKIRSSFHEDESETVEYPEETTILKLETTKIATHAEELYPTTDIEEQTLAESTWVKEVHQDFIGDRTVIMIHPEEINEEMNVKGVPTNINLQEESYETNSRDTNTEDTTIIEEVNISEGEVVKYVEDRVHPVEKNSLTPNFEAQSTHPEASANEKVGEAEDVFAIAQNHPVQEIIEVHRANTNTEKEDNNIPDCLVDDEKPEHTPAESTFDRNIGKGSLNQREQEKAKEYLAISHKDGAMAAEMALGVQMLEKAYISMSDKQIMNEADSNETSKPEVSTSSKDDPLKREDLITKTLNAEVENLRVQNEPESESNRDNGEATIMIDEVKEQTEKPESTMISLSELRSRSTKGTSHVAKRLIEESETTDEKGLQADKCDSDEDKGAKEEEEGGENQKVDSSSDAPIMVEASKDMDVKVCKKSHGILSGVGSKVKHSISKVKKVITGKSSHPKQSSPNKGIQ